MIENWLNTATTPMLAIDDAGIVIFFNQALVQYFNANTLQVGRPLTSAIVHPEFLRLIVNKIPQGEIHLPDFQRYLHVELSHITGLGSMVVMVDITYFKQAERLKRQVVTEVIRHLRSPMTAIMGYAELMDRIGEINAEQESFVEKIMFNINKMDRSLSELSALEARAKEATEDLQMVDMPMIVRYAVDGLMHAFEDKHHNITLQLEPCNPVNGDPIRIRQIVNNLLQNAIEYTPQYGSIEITVQEEGNTIVLTVADDGIGIAKEDQPYIFDKFYRTHTASNGDNTDGLGLSIVQHIVEQHGGRVWFESQPGQGTTFSVVLPCHEA